MSWVLGLAMIVVVILGYGLNWHWTGLVSETSEPQQHAKTLWDWLNLLGVLAIPAVVGLGAAWYTAQQGKVSDREHTDSQREAALQAYIDKMSELLLHEKLSKSKPESEVRKIARVLTLTILPRLDGSRKSSVLQFLYDSDLIGSRKFDEVSLQETIKERILDLEGADLSNADMRFILSLEGIKQTMLNLEGANLAGVSLDYAHLPFCRLKEANLSFAMLNYIDFDSANFTDADLGYARLAMTNLCLATLNGANLRSVNLEGANLYSAKLNDADLRSARLNGADLRSAQLKDADLRSAQLKDTDLRGVDLRHAQLDTNLNDARLDAQTLLTEKQKKLLNQSSISNISVQ